MVTTHHKPIIIDHAHTRRALLRALAPALVAACVRPSAAQPEKDRRTTLLHAEDFATGLENWVTELEAGGHVGARDGTLDMDVPAGATAWFRHELSGPVMIEYEIVAVSAGGTNDFVSDLNCFWMASDLRRQNGFFNPPRSGKFADYNALKTYYVGMGGNRNSTTRFRRYIGDDEKRPLLPENDLQTPPYLLRPNQWQTVRLIADGGTVQYFRDGNKFFDYRDGEPYTRGYFGIRTTKNHLRARRLRIYRLHTS